MPVRRAVRTAVLAVFPAVLGVLSVVVWLAHAPPTIGMPALSGRSDLPSVLTDFDQLSRVRGVLTAECLEDAGYSQPREALELALPADPLYSSGPLRVVPIDFGPTSESEARKYGLVGSPLLIDPDRGGYLISRSSAFDRETESCERSITTSVPSLDDLQEEASKWRDAVRSEFVEALMDPVEDLLLKRYECVRDAGYPQLLPAAAAASDDWEVVLEMVGVKPGRFVESESPGEESVEPGSVGVFPPPGPRKYLPTREEVSFSLAYADCGRAQGFNQSIERISEVQRSQLTAKHAEAAASLAARIRALRAEIDVFRGEGR